MKNLLILGAGTAGTTMAKHLHKVLPYEWQLTIVDQDKNHCYQPGWLFVPFDIYKPSQTKKKLDDLHLATVENPAMHMPTMSGGLLGMEAFATTMMKKEMEKLDIPPVDEFLDILTASGVNLWACNLAMEMFHLKEDALYDDIDGVLTVGSFYERAKGEGTHLMFI